MNSTVSEPIDRPITLPRCLEEPVLVRCELVDKNDHKVPSTLAGYRLRSGCTYRLRVTLREPCQSDWRLRISPCPSSIECHAEEDASPNTRTLVLRTSPIAGIGQLFRDPLAFDLPIKLDRPGTRKPYEFQVPIVMARRWRYALTLLFLPAAMFLYGYLSPLWTGVAAFAVILCGCGLWLTWDEWQLLRRAKRCIMELRKPPAFAQDGDSQVG